MNAKALRRLRQKLSNGIPVYGLWVTLDAPSITEMAVALELDWVVLDAEHGHLDWDELVNDLRGAVRSETVVLIRLAENSEALIKRALDIGADGVVIPRMETPEELKRAICSGRYPNVGRRGIGAERATAWGQCFVEHVTEASEVLVIPIIESVEGVRNAVALAQVEGAGLYFFGPADLSATAGYAGEWEGKGVPELIASASKAVYAAGKTCGVIARDHADLLARYEQGFRMIGLGLDAGLLIRALRQSLQGLGRDRKITTGFWTEIAREPGSSPQPCLQHPPEHLRPTRCECMTRLAEATNATITEGVTFSAMVGKRNGAIDLTTAIVTFAPGATLPYHTHTFAESITLLEGEARIEVAGRSYALKPFDNVSIPPGIAHMAVNTSESREAKLHVAMNSSEPARTLVDGLFARREMPSVTGTYPGAERFTSFISAAARGTGPHAADERQARTARAPRTIGEADERETTSTPVNRFVNYSNSDLIPGYRISGGYGLLQPGERVPAYLRDADESICVVHGTATCRVEGREYQLSALSTALNPCGRVHSLINESQALMAMIWASAQGVPDRIAVEESNATVKNFAWGNEAPVSLSA